jgi:hypothetical protein
MVGKPEGTFNHRKYAARLRQLPDVVRRRGIMWSMSGPPDDRDPGMLAGLPRTRPQRASTRRGGAGAGRAPRAAGADAPPPEGNGGPQAAPRRPRPRREPTRAPRLGQPAQPAGIPARPRASEAEHPVENGAGLLVTALQATCELAEIGVALSGQVLKRALDRVPRP